MTRVWPAPSFEASSEGQGSLPEDGPDATGGASAPQRLEGSYASLIRSGSLQLLMGLGLAVLLPSVLLSLSSANLFNPGSGLNTVIGTAAAVTLGFMMLWQMTRFPGLRAASYVIPCFIGSYGLLLAIFFFWRLEYARSLFLGSYALCTFWFLTATLSAGLWLRLRYAVVPTGDLDRLKTIDNTDFITLSRPALPGRPIDGLVADFRADLPDEWETFIADCVLQGRQVFDVKHLSETLTGRVDIEHLSENSLGSLDPGSAFRKFKLALDWLIAAMLLPVFGVLVAVVGTLIKLDSPGPVFFVQERIGYRGRTVRVFKFRTMTHRPAAVGDAKTQSMTQDDDPRITRLGRFLRKSRIDEVPQLLNILRAEMSWIGPRPEAKALSEWYEGELPFYRYRHVVRPGITGWAQINQGHVVEMNDVLGKLHYDFYYIKYFSPWLDAAIALRTVWVMVKGVGAR